MRSIDLIIVHCSATKADQDIGVTEIDAWHKKQGWQEIGYHFVIRRNGAVEKGRAVEKAGAHCKGRNKHSIGICLAGGIDEQGRPENNFTAEQFAALNILTASLKKDFPNAQIRGHNEFAAKACPCFDVQEYFGHVDGSL